MKLKISKSIIFLILYVVLIAVIIILGIIPSISELSADRKELADGSATLSGYQDKIAGLSKFNKNKSEIDTVEKIVNGLLPQDKSSSDFVVKMETLGNELSIQIPTFTVTEPVAQTQIKPAQEEDTTATTDKKTSTTPATTQTTGDAAPKKTDITFTMSFKTSYLNFRTFLERTESFPRFMTIGSVTMSGYNLLDDTLEYSVKGNIYYGK